MNIKTPIIGAMLAALLLQDQARAGSKPSASPIQPPVAGRVVETTNAEGYTYVLVQHGDRKTWAASRQFEVRVGDQANIPEGWVMKDFKSRTLKRTFDWILFAPAVQVNGRSGKATVESLPPGHPPLDTTAAGTATNRAAPVGAVPLEVKKGSVQKAPGGYSVEECHSRKSELRGKTVKVRGVVVKFTAAVMGKNWVHIRDGTGAAAAGDLTLTTAQRVKPGDTILAEGRMACDKDFGAGYKYAVLLEDAVISQ